MTFVIGLALAGVLMVFGIVFNTELGTLVFGDIAGFWNPMGMLVTIGGTAAALVAAHPFSLVSKVWRHIGVVLRKPPDPVYYVGIMAELSQAARKNGLLALEDSVAELEDDFLKRSLMLVVDAVEPEKARRQMEAELAAMEARHEQAAGFYDRGAALAPGFGLTGTLIGLAGMLRVMAFEETGGAARLAAGMSMALVATFYGILLANVLFVPMANQLRAAHETETLCKEIVIEGVISIQAGENPRNIREKLMAFLSESQRSLPGNEPTAETDSEG